MVFSSGRINKVRGEQENKYFIVSQKKARINNQRKGEKWNKIQ